jgi:hypothetical protein
MRPSGETPARSASATKLLGTTCGVVEEGARLGDHDERVSGQIVGEHTGLLVEVRQVTLHPVEVDPLLHEFEVVRYLGLVGGAISQGRARTGHGARAQDDLPTPEDLRGTRISDALAGARYVPAQRLDLVAEELGADRMHPVRGIDVEHTAAHGERPAFPGGLDALVSHARQASRRLLQIDGAAGYEHERLEDVGALRRQRAQQSPGRRHDDRRATGRE